MLILAHRSNILGANRLRENTLAAVEQCLDRGWGIEIDIRRDLTGNFYISRNCSGIETFAH
jgi:hypothetical protein